jgi:hypothetical protein
MAIEKHINFFELQKACEKPGCPLCRIVSDRANKYIDNTLFEHVANRGFRAVYRAAGGFCSFHSRNLVSFRDGLAVAILSRDILEDRIISFENKTKWNPKGRCPVCIERDNIENEYIDFLRNAGGNSPEERELRDFFTASDGLCAPHYHDFLFKNKKMGKTIPAWLKKFQEQKYKELMVRVEKFIELSAYGRQKEFAELSERDQVVWKEAAACININME